MKKYLFSLCLLLTGLSASAQSVSIKLTSGSELSFKSSEIKEINFKEETPAVPETPTDDGEFHNGHKYVDLGLSVLWATCNIGADKMTDYGDYFAWGETCPKTIFTHENYKYFSSSTETYTDDEGFEITKNYKGYTKYIKQGATSLYDYAGYKDFYDNKIVIDQDDDAACVNWKGSWHMPSRTERDELLNNCIWENATINGVSGCKVTSKKEGYTDRYIFLPVPVNDGTAQKMHYYWCSSVSNGSAAAFDGLGDGFYEMRYVGCLIRPVISKQNTMK